MGFQIGGAILDFVVLCVLKNEDQYGYNLTKEVREILDVSETSLYPALRRLLKEELLETYDKAYQGRNRRYYKITPKGISSLDNFLSEWETFKTRIDLLTK